VGAGVRFKMTIFLGGGGTYLRARVEPLAEAAGGEPALVVVPVVVAAAGRTFACGSRVVSSRERESKSTSF
jgi:hypothetical protein